jgi:hypothetical protein
MNRAIETSDVMRRAFEVSRMTRGEIAEVVE